MTKYNSDYNLAINFIINRFFAGDFSDLNFSDYHEQWIRRFQLPTADCLGYMDNKSLDVFQALITLIREQ